MQPARCTRTEPTRIRSRARARHHHFTRFSPTVAPSVCNAFHRCNALTINYIHTIIIYIIVYTIRRAHCCCTSPPTSSPYAQPAHRHNHIRIATTTATTSAPVCLPVRSITKYFVTRRKSLPQRFSDTFRAPRTSARKTSSWRPTNGDTKSLTVGARTLSRLYYSYYYVIFKNILLPGCTIPVCGSMIFHVNKHTSWLIIET